MTQGASLTLTAKDVEQLLSARDGTKGRMDVAQKIAGSYEHQGFADSESLVAEQIFRLLVRDTELDIRVMMAENLKSSARIPRDIVLTMARDVEQVALPVLKHSEVLTELDLIDLVHESKSLSRHTAIASRASVPEGLSGVLLETGSEPVMATLVQNEGAQISQAALEGMVELHRTKGDLMKMLAARDRLPVTVAEKLITAVSGSLAQALKDKYKLDDDTVKSAEEKSRESATLALIRRAHSPEDIDRLVAQLITFQRMTPNLLMAALSQGHVAFFEAALAEMADVPPSNAKKLLSDASGLGFRGIYNRAKLPEKAFVPFKRVFEAAHAVQSSRDFGGGTPFAERVVRYLQQRAEVSGENAEPLIRVVRSGIE